jgi:hypothetical protein
MDFPSPYGLCFSRSVESAFSASFCGLAATWSFALMPSNSEVTTRYCYLPLLRLPPTQSDPKEGRKSVERPVASTPACAKPMLDLTPCRRFLAGLCAVLNKSLPGTLGFWIPTSKGISNVAARPSLTNKLLFSYSAKPFDQAYTAYLPGSKSLTKYRPSGSLRVNFTLPSVPMTAMATPAIEAPE